MPKAEHHLSHVAHLKAEHRQDMVFERGDWSLVEVVRQRTWYTVASQYVRLREAFYGGSLETPRQIDRHDPCEVLVMLQWLHRTIAILHIYRGQREPSVLL